MKENFGSSIDTAAKHSSHQNPFPSGKGQGLGLSGAIDFDGRTVGLLAALAITFCSIGWWLGCGVKSPPRPPEDVRPERITDLRAVPVENGVRLSWGRPERFSGGGTMRTLNHFVVLRAEGNEEPTPLISLPLNDRERFQRQRHMSFVDATAQLNHFYRYTVISETDDNYESLQSNQAALYRTPPSPTPNPENFAFPTPTMIP
jgi:hypothetical protein